MLSFGEQRRAFHPKVPGSRPGRPTRSGAVHCAASSTLLYGVTSRLQWIEVDWDALAINVNQSLRQVGKRGAEGSPSPTRFG